MAILRPLKVVIENYPEGRTEQLDAINNPNDPAAGSRPVPFGRDIERDDFMEDPPGKFFRLGPGREVRLRYAYFITCREVVKNDLGEIVELRCAYDPRTRGGDAPDGRKVKGTLHWVSAEHGVRAEIRLYDLLFKSETPGAEGDLLEDLNPRSLEILADAVLEPSLRGRDAGEAVQFERQGYFCADPDGTPDRPVFNRTVSMKDGWAKVKGRG